MDIFIIFQYLKCVAILDLTPLIHFSNKGFTTSINFDCLERNIVFSNAEYFIASEFLQQIKLCYFVIYISVPLFIYISVIQISDSIYI